MCECIHGCECVHSFVLAQHIPSVECALLFGICTQVNPAKRSVVKCNFKEEEEKSSGKASCKEGHVLNLLGG